MRRLFPALALLLLPLLPAAAQDREALAKLAMEAKLQTGDLLREKGDLDGALRAYADAIAIYEGLKRDRPMEVVEDAPRAPANDEGDAIKMGIRWLAAHQDVEGDGKWDADEFMRHDAPGAASDGAGGALYDVGVSGLALLALLGNGHMDRGSAAENPYAENVRAGLRFLLTAQDEEGCFGTRTSQHFIYNHVCATLAMVEAVGKTKNPRYREPAQKGVDFILRAQNPYLGWRYGVRPGDNDTSVTGLCILTLRAAEGAGLKVEKNAFAGALAWVEKMTDAEFGRAGYHVRGGATARPQEQIERFPAEKSEAMTACGILTRIHCGENPRTNGAILKGVQLCLDHMPVWDTRSGEIDMYYWYFATHALYHVGAPAWNKWYPRVVDAIMAGQRGKGTGGLEGSWDPAGPWGNDGGRVYSTAMAVLTLEVGFNRAAPAAR